MLQVHKTRRLHLGRSGLHAPMAVREQRIAIRVEEIRWPQRPEVLRERRNDGESLVERRDIPWAEPKAPHPFEEATEGLFGVRVPDRIELP